MSPQPRSRLLILCTLTLVLIATLVGIRFIQGANFSDTESEASDQPVSPVLSTASPTPATLSSSPNLPSLHQSRLIIRPADEASRLAQRRNEALLSMGESPRTSPPKPRTPLAKEPLQRPPGEEYLLLVKFRDDLVARSNPTGDLIISTNTPNKALQAVIDKFDLSFSTSQTTPEDDLIRLEARALARTDTEPADLGGMIAAHPANTSPDNMWASAQALQNLDAVEFVALSSLDQPPPPPRALPVAYDINPPTESLTSYQHYRTSLGINTDAAWSTYGARGQGVRVTDCEYNVNFNHEDLRGQISPQPWVTARYTNFGNDHGTAVLGILGAVENNYGMTGTVPDADFWFYGDLSTVKNLSQHRAATITAALAASSPGDIVLLEMQTGGFGSAGQDTRYVPAEYAIDVWLAVKTGTDAGIHVIGAAGNGKEDLDAPGYTSYRNRGDSGAIIVGAGTRNRVRAEFSTFGSRVNVQGWGAWDVATLGYGTLRNYDNDPDQLYSSSFSGTSSASPIVTSVAAAVESIARPALGRSLTPSELRSLLINTGKPQTGDTNQHIGPLPDTMAALDELLSGSPTISTVTPAQGVPGTIVLIHGTGFLSVSAVKFDGVAASFNVTGSSLITASVPPNARSGRITITTPAGTGVSPQNFQIIAGADYAYSTISPSSLTNFTTQKGTPSPTKTFSFTADNLDGPLKISAPLGYEISLNGTHFTTSTNIPAAPRTDNSSNYWGWTNNSNAGLGFGSWKITKFEGLDYYVNNFINPPIYAEIEGFGTQAFGLTAYPSNSLAAISVDRPLSRPLKTGDTLRFQWAVNWDAGGLGAKGFTIYSGGTNGTELLTVIQGDYPGNILFSKQGNSTDTKIEYGTRPMSWSFTRTSPTNLLVTSTPRNGDTNIAFSTNIPILGSPDTIQWFTTKLRNDPATPAENYRRLPYFDNLAILPATNGGGAIAPTTIYTRLAATAHTGNIYGDITLSSSGTLTGIIPLSGTVTPKTLAYDDWALSFGLDPQGAGAPSADPDGDNFNNLTEFAFGTSPIASTASLTTWTPHLSQRSLSFLALVSGASYQIETREDITTPPWSPSPITPTISPDQSGVPEGYHRLNLSIPESPRAFYRIKVTVP